jgi:hypothetical protein
MIIDIENINGMISMGTPGIPKKMHLVGTTKQGETSGSFNIEIDSQSNDKHMIIDAQIKQLPVAIFDLFIAHRHPAFDNIATTAIGNTLDLNLSSTYRNGASIFKLGIESRGLQAELHGQLTNSKLVVTTPSELTLAVTPELVRYFSNDDLLEKQAKAVVVLDQVVIPRNQKLTDLTIKFHLDQDKSDQVVKKYLDGIQVSVDTKKDEQPHLVLINQDLQMDLYLNIPKRRISGSVRINPDIQLQLAAQISPKDELHLDIKGSALNLDAVIADGGNYRITADADNFPITRVCHFVCFNPEMREKVEAVLGNRVTGRVSAHVRDWSGSLVADIMGDNGKIILDGRLNHGTLTLNAPITAELKLTQKLGREVLEELFPLFSGVIHGEQPVSLRIAPEGFSFPLNPFSVDQVRIQNAELDLNKVVFSNEGELGSILTLLNPKNEDQLLVWFTPLYFSMENGTLQLSRIDLLIMNEYPIATWGKVNFVKDKVNITIGLTARAIEQAFNAKSLPPKYMLQLSLKGPINDAKIDRSKAAAKISSLIAKTQGIEGNLLGTVIDVASGNLKEDKPPKPTTDPLPWDTEGTAPKSAPKEQSKKKMSFILDQLEKRAGSLLPWSK